jgi:glycosyltransferase involved in cell wall biosynthesis
MRIAFDHQAFSRQRYGGVTRYFFHLIKSLLEISSNEIKIVTPVHINEYINALPSNIIYGKFLNGYPLKSKRLFQLFNTFAGRFHIGLWQPDVIHETYFSNVRTGFPGVPTVVTVYDMTHELFPEKFFPWDKTSANKKKAVDRAHHVICISESTRNDLLRIFNVPANKVSVIYLAYEKDKQDQPGQTSPPFHDNNRPYILFVGHRSGYKNFNRLLTALAIDREILEQFDAICFGGSKFTYNELSLIKKLGLSKSVRQVSGNDEFLTNLYTSASALVYPSLYEGFGLPLLEAMAHNCPVICSNTSSLPEVVGDAAELFDPTDEDSMLRALKNVLLSRARQNELVDRGRYRSSLFSWKKCAEQTLKVYEKIVKKR